MLPCRLEKCFGPLNRYLSKVCSETGSLGIEVTTFFGINNFGRVQTMKVMFFSKSSKFHADLQNAIKLPRMVYDFEVKCV